jgi:hypothetical protein
VISQGAPAQKKNDYMKLKWAAFGCHSRAGGNPEFIDVASANFV